MRPEAVVAVPASFLRRGVAFAIDVGILTFIGLALSAAFGDTSELSSPDKLDRTVLATVMIAGASYHLFFLITMSATPGKLAMMIYVANLQGERIRPDTAILRYLVYFVGQTIFIGMMVSLVLVIVDPRKRAVHDRIAGTMVVVGRPPGFEGTR